jgi:predicted nucleic acid-binding protein
MPSRGMNCFVDTNVLLYAVDGRVPEKQNRAAEWLDALSDKNLAVISPQVMNEFARSVLGKFRHIEVDRLLDHLEDIAAFCVAPTSAETAMQGVIIHHKYKLAFYDAVLISSALLAKCRVFLTEDLTHGQSFGPLQIVNPFMAVPSELL